MRTCLNNLLWLLVGIVACALFNMPYSAYDSHIEDLNLEEVNPMFKPVSELFQAVEENDEKRVLEIFSHIEPELLDALNIAKKLKRIEFRRIELLTFEFEEPQYLICVFQLEAGSKFSRTVSFEMIRVENLNGNLRIKSIPGFLL